MRRESRGRGGPLPRLTSGEVDRIKYLTSSSNLTDEQIAHRFGISPELTRRIVAGQYQPRDLAARARRS